MSLFQVDAGQEWRGGQRQVWLLARELQAQGYDSTLVVPPGSPLHEKAVADGLPVRPMAMRNEADLWAVAKLALAMKKSGCVLAHFHDAHGLAVGSAAARLAKVPVRFLSRRVDFPIQSKKKYTEGVDAIVAISEGVKSVLLQGGIPDRLIHVVPSGIDFSPFDEALPKDFLRKEFGFADDDYLVGIVAQLEDHKGHAYLLEAVRAIKAQAPKMRLIVVGEGSLRLDLTKQAQDLRVDDIVFFLGFRHDVPKILASLDLFVLSSHMEGLGTSLMDAMAAGLPIVATMAGGIPEVVLHRETGLLVPPRDPQALAQSILKLYLDRALAARLAAKGREVVHEKFSAEAMARRIITLYERVARRKGVRLGRPARPHKAPAAV